jgi:hypothetical protein
MSNINETAVQQFNWWVNWELESLLDGTLGYNEFKKQLETQFIQALAMEKEQMEVAYREGYTDCSLGRFSDSEKYYNETYGN